MGDGLGVDLGTTSTVAAVHRGSSTGGRTELVQLGADAYSVPSVVSWTAEGVWLAGDAAERRMSTHPGSTVREYKRRFGDPAPIVIDGVAHPPEALTAAQLADVVERTERALGARPSTLALAHPAAWGPFRLEALRSVARSVGYDDVLLVAEPVAAAVANRDRLRDGAVVAVYDLGGGTFDAAVVRCEGADRSWAVIGVPEGVERLGGTDIDQAVLGHVDAVLGGQVFALDSGDADARAALIRLRDACRQAKEHLSEDTDVEIPVDLPNVRTSVRLTRAELEGMIRPRLADSLAVLDRVVASAGLTWDAVDAVLLVGGSSRIPAVAQLVQERCSRPVITATNPQLAVALGTAAMLADPAAVDARDDVGASGAMPPPVAAGPAPVPAASGAEAGDGATAGPAPAPGASIPGMAARDAAERADRRRVSMAVRGVIAAIVVIAVVAAVVLTRGGEPDGDGASQAPTSQGTTQTTGTEADASPATDVAGTDTSESTAPLAGDAATTVAGETTAADGALAALGLDAVGCTGQMPSGVTGLASDGERVFVAAGGALVMADLAAGSACELGATGEPLLESGAASVGVVGRRLVAVASPDGGSVIAADGTVAACALLAGSVAGNGEGLALVWDSSGAADRVAVSASGCEITQPDTFPDLAVVAATFRSANGVVVAGRSNGALVVSAYQRRNLEWEQRTFASPDDPPYASIDGLTMCGEKVCVVDATEGRLHVIDADGVHLGSVRLVEVFGDGTSFAAIAATPDGAILAGSGPDGTTQIVRVSALGGE